MIQAAMGLDEMRWQRLPAADLVLERIKPSSRIPLFRFDDRDCRQALATGIEHHDIVWPYN
jgi:hypothetical protein